MKPEPPTLHKHAITGLHVQPQTRISLIRVPQNTDTFFLLEFSFAKMNKNSSKSSNHGWGIQLEYINMDYQKEKKIYIYILKSHAVRLSKFPHWGRLSKEAREVTNDLALGRLTSVTINRKAGRSQKAIIGPLGSHVALVI